MKLNSFDEWSPLKEVIVGCPINYKVHKIDYSFKVFFDENITAFDANLLKEKNAVYSIKEKYLNELTEDVEKLVKTLQKLGVKVHRPISISDEIKVKTPYWEANCIPALNLRDRAIVLGDEIIETPPVIRSRYFETDLLKPIFYQYFKQGARWTTMPHPMMSDSSFDLSYIKNTSEKDRDYQAAYGMEPSKFDVGYEIMIDAAHCLRFGQDIIVNVANENHELAFEWLQRHLEGRYRLHRIYRLADSHVDTCFLPLRPGLLLMRTPKYLDMLPEPLQKWDIIYFPQPSDALFPVYDDDDLILTSQYMDLNVLSIDEERVIVNSYNTDLIKLLEKHKFTPIPVPHRHRRLFAGGFHCFTLDTVREGVKEDYFNA